MRLFKQPPMLFGLTVLLVFVVVFFLQKEQAWNRGVDELTMYLREHGVSVRLISTYRDGGCNTSGFLTVNQYDTWEMYQSKPRVVSHIDEWAGIVYVEQVNLSVNVDYGIASLGENGCRVGNFLLFGDAALIRRIQDAVL